MDPVTGVIAAGIVLLALAVAASVAWWVVLKTLSMIKKVVMLTVLMLLVTAGAIAVWVVSTGLG